MKNWEEGGRSEIPRVWCASRLRSDRTNRDQGGTAPGAYDSRPVARIEVPSEIWYV